MGTIADAWRGCLYLMLGSWAVAELGCHEATGPGPGETDAGIQDTADSTPGTASSDSADDATATPGSSDSLGDSAFGSGSDSGSDGSGTDPPCTDTEPGFIPEYEEWRLPVDDLGRALLRDLTGDGRLDIIEVKDGDTWSFARNSGHGFEPLVDWPAPVLVMSEADSWMNDQWALLDMNGDGRVDLVWSAEAADDPIHQRVFFDDLVGQHWRVYLNDGAGFSSDYTAWSLGLSWSPYDPVFAMVRVTSIWSQTMMWDTFDLNGDQLPDLIVTGECPGAQLPCQALIGGPHAAKWSVHWNTGAGFSSEAADWSVPFSGEWPYSLDFSSLSRGYFATFELSNDGLPDFVWGLEMETWSGLAATIREGEVFGRDQGQPYWRVFLNTGLGFSMDDSSWAVPMDDPALEDSGWLGFYAPEPDPKRAYAPSSERWTTRDFTGDGMPDFAWTADPRGFDSGALQMPWGGDLGDPHWRIYPYDEDGFAPSPIRWTLPAVELGHPLAKGFYAPTDSWLSRPSSETQTHWSTLDLDGDGLPDLVWMLDSATRETFGMEDGAPYWRVFRGSAGQKCPQIPEIQ